MTAQTTVAEMTNSSSSASQWSDLKCGDYVGVYREGTLVGRGGIDDKTVDSSVIWVLFHGRGRAMFHLEDGVFVVLEDCLGGLGARQEKGDSADLGGDRAS